MYTISSLTALILAICVSQSQAYITTGECIDSPVIKDFQVSQVILIVGHKFCWLFF